MSEPLQAQSQQQAPLLFRICIGGTCLVFLIVLIFGRMIFEGPGVMDSISDYYYSPSMHTVFVGGLCVLATLLICYRYENVDTFANFLAGSCAIGVAIFPKAPDPNSPECQPIGTQCPTAPQIGIGNAHFAFAGLFLAIIAIIALVLFTLSNQNPLPTRKRQRNWFFRACGIAMFVCIGGCFVVQQFFLPGNRQLQSLHPVFWFELVALVLFIIAWLFKGQVLLQDENLGLSSLPLILTYLRDILPKAITSLLAIFSAKGSPGKSDPKPSQSSTSAIELSDASHLASESLSDDLDE